MPSSFFSIFINCLLFILKLLEIFFCSKKNYLYTFSFFRRENYLVFFLFYREKVIILYTLIIKKLFNFLSFHIK